MHATILITITGPQRHVDLEIPGYIPIAELLPLLLEICGTLSMNPTLKHSAGWGLVVLDSANPLTPTVCVKDAGIVDGAVLKLQSMEEWAKQRERLQSFIPQAIPGVVKRWNTEGFRS